MSGPHMSKRSGEDWIHPLNSIWIKYEVLIPQNKKTPRPFDRSTFLADFLATFSSNWPFRQQKSQQMLTKFFSSNRDHQTEQKTFLRFFHSHHSFFKIVLWKFLGITGPFKNVTFIFQKKSVWCHYLKSLFRNVIFWKSTKFTLSCREIISTCRMIL